MKEKKIEPKEILRIVIVVVISAMFGAITLLLVNRVSNITYNLSSRFFNAFWDHPKAFGGFCIIILVGVVETQIGAIPIRKILKKETNVTVKSVLISVAVTSISIVLGFVTLYILCILSYGFMKITGKVLELVMTKWMMIYGVIIVVIIGLIEWMFIKPLFWEKNEKKVLPKEGFDVDEVSDEILNFLNGDE